MQPEIHFNFWAVIVCVAVAMPLGFLWFGPIFGTSWAKHMGMQDMEKPGGGAMAKSMLLYAVGSLLIAFVLAHLVEVWRPSTWGIGTDQASWIYGLHGALWTWVGFFLPLQIGCVAWELKRWGLVAINAGFDLVRLALFGQILAFWR